MPNCTCGEEFPSQSNLNEHQKNKCKNRYLSCELCNENIPSCDMNYHLFYCASKTSQCPICSKYIRRSIYNYHIENNCQDLDEDLVSDEEQFESNTNNIQLDDEILIPCEICNEQIQFSSYDFHSRNCFPNQTHRRLDSNLPRSVIDNSTYEQETNDELINSNTTHQMTNPSDVVLKLEKKTNNIRHSLRKDFYHIEVEHATEKLQYNILLMGAPRVGKSQLINALCDKEDLAKTSPSLNSCTKDVTCYVLKDNQQKTPGIQPFQINFYDTPGIESWIQQKGEETMLKFIEDINPICLIYCASPGSFADLKQLQIILKFCKKKQIFCALVCTNMWSGPQRKTVIEEFQQQLAFFGDRVVKSFEQNDNRKAHEVIVFGNGALCTMVNSKEYYDPDLSEKIMPVQGIDELIHCIMESLDEEKLIGWCYTVLYRRSFWEKVSHKINGLCLEDLPKLLYKTANQTATYFANYLKKIT